ncbi:MAG: transketolase C-terminal domain-containing protein [Gaiella sp.]
MSAVLELIPREAFGRVAGDSPDDTRLALLADMCRHNALVAVKRAGSGHLGSTLSSLDIVAHLLWRELDTRVIGWDSPDRDVFFSSKGHDVPGLYAALHGLGVLGSDRLMLLRRLGGLDGHPDVGVPGIEANTGSLGMGISKGRGIAWAKRHLGRGGRAVVMVGDGELQEGQNFEALQAAAHQRTGNLVVIVDRNALQSDKPTDEILALGDLEAKLRVFGWQVERCDGHDHRALSAAFLRFRDGDAGQPKALVADTIKGKGISFMEHPHALAEGAGTYRWHSGAPDDDAYAAGRSELLERIGAGFAALDLGSIDLVRMLPPARENAAVSLQGEPESGAGAGQPLKATAEFVAAAYGEELLELAARHPELVVLDADLASDCRVRGFELEYAARFVENGIAEQDMVSMAAGLARHGLLPVVNSFASFLASRANEQIYNQASERSKVIYALHYAGLIPAGPGKSHQSLRDISLLGALPGFTILQPGNGAETRRLLRWAVEDASGNVALRLAIGPSPRPIEGLGTTPPSPGVGTELVAGGDGTLLAYGPVMLHEALLAAETLRAAGTRLRVVAMPWLNVVDATWAEELAAGGRLFVLEDHSPVGGLGDAVRRALPGTAVTVFGVEGWPACGTPPEALAAHGLDGASLARRIAAALT